MHPRLPEKGFLFAEEKLGGKDSSPTISLSTWGPLRKSSYDDLQHRQAWSPEPFA